MKAELSETLEQLGKFAVSVSLCLSPSFSLLLFPSLSVSVAVCIAFLYVFLFQVCLSAARKIEREVWCLSLYVLGLMAMMYCSPSASRADNLQHALARRRSAS